MMTTTTTTKRFVEIETEINDKIRNLLLGFSQQTMPFLGSVRTYTGQGNDAVEDG
jgi:hypothetical protein